jgi:hypothetical protein
LFFCTRYEDVLGPGELAVLEARRLKPVVPPPREPRRGAPAAIVCGVRFGPAAWSRLANML